MESKNLPDTLFVARLCFVAKYQKMEMQTDSPGWAYYRLESIDEEAEEAGFDFSNKIYIGELDLVYLNNSYFTTELEANKQAHNFAEIQAIKKTKLIDKLKNQ